MTNTTPNETLDVLVIGAGAVGGAIALGAVRQGLRVGVLERNPAPAFDPDTTPVTRVATLNDASMAFLEALGVRAALEQRRAHAFSGMYVWDANGPGHIRFDADALGVPALGWTVELAALESVLWRELETAGVALYPQTEWKTLDRRPKRVDVYGDRRQPIASARLLVAADGARSRVRESVGIPFTGRDYDACGIVATITTEHPHQDTAWQRFVDDRIIALLPLADGRCSIVWSQPEWPAAEDTLALDDAAFCAALEQETDGCLGAITATSPRASFPLTARHAKTYHSGRVVLAGDAAHTIHPLAGQGLNLGLADARALTERLRGPARHDPGAETVLRAYTRDRRPENAFMQRAMDGFRLLFGHQTAGLPELRGLGLRLVDQADPIKRRLARRAFGLGG
ncbi:Ubiquinone biosynthesis hydroxylase, UbiH/UbiF/VisC/COQ6 family [Thioalkalivibrio sp. K90mix]|uniref:FAD-dependent monooxygenase n=1 Tax=Thioalkalivibrio sp. (strain K90mix) TaxID=396595 RepID=UPI000195A501|nr:FAD-dependent monooxygenase [Thioalkalivibrio sp. K90mix]ADC72310.1 Ubiquinone biosynthesis hydroxylase, UbiH/UbiF/VisC/COQ6 family [Thioalkalivibrio sp. K90mix]